MLGLSRVILLGVGVLVFLGGIAILASGVEGSFVAGLVSLVTGGILIVAIALERSRYRSMASDRSNPPIGPGGGEPERSLEPRFRPTDEVFVDPTSQARMRVHVDPTTGERRYVAEG